VSGSATNQTNPVVSGDEVEPGNTVVVVDELDRELCWTTAAASGEWTCTSDLALTEGNHTLAAFQVDPDGVESPATTASLVVDLTPPTVVLMAKTQVYGTARVEFAGTAEVGTVVRVWLDDANRESDPLCEATSVNRGGIGQWSCESSIDLLDGTHAIQLVGQDPVGNESAPLTDTVTVDATPPAPAVVTSPQPGAILDDTTVTVSGTAEVGADVKVQAGDKACDIQAVDGTWSCTLPALDPGPATLVVTVTDAVGNESAPVSVPVTVEGEDEPTTPPPSPTATPTEPTAGPSTTSASPSASVSPTAGPSTASASPSASVSPTVAPSTASASPSASASPTAGPSTASASPRPSASASPRPSTSATASPTASASPTRSASATPSASPSPSFDSGPYCRVYIEVVPDIQAALAELSEADNDIEAMKSGLRKLVTNFTTLADSQPPADAVEPLNFLVNHFAGMLDAVETLNVTKMQDLAAQEEELNAAFQGWIDATEAACQVTASPSASPTAGATASDTPTSRPSATPTSGPSASPTAGPSATPTPVAALTVKVEQSGATVKVRGSGFQAGERITASLTVSGAPLPLGEAHADATGNVEFVGTLPATVAYGDYTVNLVGEKSGEISTPFHYSDSITQTGPRSLVGLLGLTGLLVLSVAGFAMLTAARYRRRETLAT
jgi:hypothetical protein